jgi:starch synthase
LIAGAPFSLDNQVYSLDPAADGYKFTFFSLAALELARFLGWTPQVLHANDWHTAPAVYALNVRKDPFFRETTTVMVVHNLPYLGEGAEESLRKFGLPPASGSPLPDWAQGLPLPQGVLTAWAIVAPSPSYAREIQTPEFGAGLDAFLRSRQESIFGILNGINVENWDQPIRKSLYLTT